MRPALSNRRGTKPQGHSHVSFRVIDGQEDPVEEKILGHHPVHEADQPHHFYRKPTPRSSIDINDMQAKGYISGLMNRWKASDTPPMR